MAPLSANVNVLSATPRLLVPRQHNSHANVTLGQKAETYSREKRRVVETTLRKAESGDVNLPGPANLWH
jgi:hypothetical protein